MATTCLIVYTYIYICLQLSGPTGQSTPSFLAGKPKRVSFGTKRMNVKAMAAEPDDKKNSDKWSGLAFDDSDDQQDITRGKGLVDSLFQAPMGDGTHIAVLQSYEYVSQGLRQSVLAIYIYKLNIYT
jgi:hypothetical protein